MPEEIQEIRLLREQTREKIRRLEARSHRGLWALALFTLVSVVASRGFDLLPKLPESAWEALGTPPSPDLVSLGLIVYTFSAIILILSRMTLGHTPSPGFAHVGYLTGFYVFFHLADGKSENFWAVFAAGVTILGLASYHLRNHLNEAVRQEREVLATLDRREKFLGGVPEPENPEP